MTDSYDKFRKSIRKIISEEYSMNETPENNNSSSGEDELLEWDLFEEFGQRVLMEIGYKGSYSDIVYRVKKELEEDDGWLFNR